MVLTTTSDKIEWRLGYAHTATAPTATVDYADNTKSTGAWSRDREFSTSSGTSQVTLVSSPASGVERFIREINIYNGDTRPHVLFIRFYNGSAYEEEHMAIGPGDTVVYIESDGWRAHDYRAARRLGLSPSMYQPSIIQPPGQSPTIASTKTLTNGTTFAYYLGTAHRDFSSIAFTFQVTTLGVNITWAEIAVATGAWPGSANASLTRLGSAVSIATEVTTATAKLVPVTGLSGTMGMELWVLMGSQVVTTQPIVRAGEIDFMRYGEQQAAVTTRPSTMSGATAFTLEANTVRPIQYKFQLVP